MESIQESKEVDGLYSSCVQVKFDTQMVDDSLENIYSYVADTKEHMLVAKTNEGYL